MTEPDRQSDGQPYELFVFARRHGIELERARLIIADLGLIDRVPTLLLRPPR